MRFLGSSLNYTEKLKPRCKRSVRRGFIAVSNEDRARRDLGIQLFFAPDPQCALVNQKRAGNRHDQDNTKQNQKLGRSIACINAHANDSQLPATLRCSAKIPPAPWGVWQLFYSRNYPRYRDNHITTGFVFGTVILEPQKVSEFLHDDIRANNVNFRELVIGADEQLAGMLSATVAEAQAGNPAGRLFSQSMFDGIAG